MSFALDPIPHDAPPARPAFLVHPAGAAQHASARRAPRPWSARIAAPKPDPDEDATLPGLLDAARYYFEQLIGLFGPPEEIAAQTVVAARREGLLRCWAPNLAGIVRQLLLVAALALMAGLAAPCAPRRRATPIEARAPRIAARARPLMLAVGSLASEASRETAAAPGGRQVAPRRPAPGLLADLVARIGATLADFDGCARRLARRLVRAEHAAGESLVFIQPDPPPDILPGGRYNPLSRKARMAWAHAAAQIDRLRPLYPGDG